MSDQSQEIDVVQPSQAAAILEPKLKELQEEGWVVLVQTDYMARLTRGKINLDVRVDLLGNLILEEKPLTLVQESGQLVALLLVMVLLFLAFTLATVLDLF